MIAIDTNILVRLFVEDADNYAQLNLVKQLLHNQDAIYVSQVVQIELVWVLESAYNLSKSEVISVLKALLNHPNIVLEHSAQFAQALELFISSNADFSDYIIFSNANELGYPFWTFDKKLAKTHGAIRLTKQALQHH